MFGYGGAVFAGFLLTAGPGGTGTAPVAGRPLALLALVWLAGRVVMALAGSLPGWLVAAVDLAFLPALALAVAGPLLAARKPHNVVFLGLIGLLVGCNALVHAEGLGLLARSASAGVRLAVDTAALMIAMIGGRVVPAFTANALAARGIAAKIVRSPVLDRAAVLATALFLLADGLRPGTMLAGLLALAAAALHVARLSGWRTLRTLDTPILWVLHLGYVWLAVGLGLRALASLTPVIPDSVALHGLTIGAIGTMTMAVMSRAVLGHTGRPLVAARRTVAAYVLISLAALVRLGFAGMHPAAHTISGLLWAAALALFVLVHAPMLIGPRVDEGS
jgi:uncharacterized protein involved in response to NO